MPIFIIGASNDQTQLWIANTDEGTVKAVSADGASAGAEEIGVSTIQTLRRNGYTVTRDVDVAVLADASNEPVSRQFTE